MTETAYLDSSKQHLFHLICEAICNDRNVAITNVPWNIWKSAGVPTAASGNLLGDLCYDYTNKDVYICTAAATTWTKITD